MEIREIWKTIEGHPNYMVSNFGRVKSNKTRCIKKSVHIDGDGYHLINQTTHPTGYKMLKVDGETKKVHRLVAEAFIGNERNLKEINHIDGDKSNNNSSNLEWCTRSENLIHAYKTGLRKPIQGHEKVNAKPVIATNGRTTIEFFTISAGARFFGVSLSILYGCLKRENNSCCGYTWRFSNDK